MTTLLRVLLVEDSEDDAALLVRELRKGGYTPEFQRVDNGADLEAALVHVNTLFQANDFFLNEQHA
jgi:hypothetical protein